MLKWTYLAFGSVVGGFARYILAGAVHEKLGTEFPYGTLIVNLTGCLIIGFLNSLAEDKFLLGTNERVLLMTGFCGAYTTFYTLMLETSNLVKDGEIGRGLLNLSASVVVGFLLFRIGDLIGKTI